jgi:hypothetical protein
MAEWRPLAELGPSMIDASGTDGSMTEEPSTRRHLRRALQPLTRIVQVATILTILLNGVFFALHALLEPKLHVFGSGHVATPHPHAAWFWPALLLGGGVILAIKIPFYVWVYRVVKNARGFAGDLRVSAGWAVGAFFIPIVGWILPFIALQDSWKASCAPDRWRELRPSRLLICWWIFHVSLSLLFFVTFELRTSALLSHTAPPALLESIQAALASLTDVLRFAFVTTLTRRQLTLTRPN